MGSCERYNLQDHPPQTRLMKMLRVLMLRMAGAHIAWNCNVHPSVKIEYPWRLTMGSLSSLGEKSWAYCLDKITIGEKSCIGKEVNLITGSHDITSTDFHLITKPITIGNGVWITTRATVLMGVTIRDYSIVANNTVVTKNIEPCMIVGGNPARVIKQRIIKQ